MSNQDDVLREITDIISPGFAPRKLISQEKFLSNPDLCPSCRSEDVFPQSELQYMDEFVERTYKCKKCQTRWKERFQLISYHILDNDSKVENPSALLQKEEIKDAFQKLGLNPSLISQMIQNIVWFSDSELNSEADIHNTPEDINDILQ